jgi:hypothetical protein
MQWWGCFYVKFPCGHPPPTGEARLLLRSSSLMTPSMSGNCIPSASSIDFRSPRSSLFSCLFSSSTSTYGAEVVFCFWYIDLRSEKSSFRDNLLETPRTWSHCSLDCRALVRPSFSLLSFECSLLSLKVL